MHQLPFGKRAAVALVCLLIARGALAVDAAYEKSIEAFLHENFDHGDVGMVVALVDKDGTRTYSAGKLGNGTDQLVDADTFFEMGSCTKTFTALLLQEMARRGEVKLDDPVAKYLPGSVKVPSRSGKQITLANLACQDSGLPFNATNHKGNNWYERFASYTTADMYAFLSNYELKQDPGAAFQYSNIGMGVLGHALSLKAGKDYESLVRERICQPLHMDNTFVNVPPEMKSRMAHGHDENLKPMPDLEISAIAGAGALRSTANDLVKYVSANIDLAPSDLAPLMHDMQVFRHHNAPPQWGNTAMPWYDMSAYNPPGSELIGHGGGTGGFSTFIGFDKQRHCGVVALSNQERIHSSILGYRILQHARLDGLDAVKMMPIQQITGLGLVLDFNEQDHVLRIKGTQPKSPGARAKIVSGTIIESIDGVPTTGKSLDESAALIRGDAGTVVKLALKEPDQTESKTVELTREKMLIGE